jgi:hypothetical protein
MLGRFVQVYCDDIPIFSKTREEHLVHVCMVLETLRHHKLFAKTSKCRFGRSSVGFLGHVISERGVAVDPRKVAAVAEWATPQSCTDVPRFVGLANYYREFVLRLSALAAPFNGSLQPARPIRLGRRRAAELRRAQGGADLSPDASCGTWCWLSLQFWSSRTTRVPSTWSPSSCAN